MKLMQRSVIGLGIIVGLSNIAHAQEAKPGIENFRFMPTKVCLGDLVQYAFSYRNLPGGLAAVKSVAISAERPGDQSRHAVFVLAAGEREKHSADTDSFESWTWYWPTLQDRAPPGGVNIQHQLKLTLFTGEEITATAMLRYEEVCRLPVAVASLSEGSAGRIGFSTTTLTSPQFLTGAKEGSPATIWGDLQLPSGAAGRVPAVILAHGLGGVGVRETRWAEALNAMGVATFVLNSYTGRGLNTRADVQTKFSILANTIDAYRALELLATHPRIDAKRIALMGASRGGFVALFGSLTRFRRMHAPADVEFAAYLPFYPVCRYKFIEGDQISDRPVRIFHGAADDQQPVAWCRTYVERLRAAGKDVALTEYAGAHHVFDDPVLPPAQRLPVPNQGRCFLVETHVGQLINQETEKPPSRSDPCVTRGVTHGYNHSAHADSVRAVKEFLSKIFALDRL